VPKGSNLEGLRRYRPWWRRELLLSVLEETWPRWLLSSEIDEICRALRPDYDMRRGRGGDSQRSLERLVTLGYVDRIGEANRGLAGRPKGGLPGSAWLTRPITRRYRIIHRP
jgi:hypothetical protein